MDVRVVSCSTHGDDKVIKIAVPSIGALKKYKPKQNESIVVVIDGICPQKDIEEIKKYCIQLDYVYEGHDNAGPDLV